MDPSSIWTLFIPVKSGIFNNLVPVVSVDPAAPLPSEAEVVAAPAPAEATSDNVVIVNAVNSVLHTAIQFS